MDEILQKLEAIERNTLLAAKEALRIEDVAMLTGISKSHLYRLTSQNKIPYYRPTGGGFIYFSRKEIEDWLLRNRVSTIEENEIDATTYCVTHKR